MLTDDTRTLLGTLLSNPELKPEFRDLFNALLKQGSLNTEQKKLLSSFLDETQLADDERELLADFVDTLNDEQKSILDSTFEALWEKTKLSDHVDKSLLMEELIEIKSMLIQAVSVAPTLAEEETDDENSKSEEDDFTDDQTDVAIDNYKILVSALTIPESYFLRLEDFGKSVTVGDVQKYLFNKLILSIHEILSINHRELNWDLTAECDLIQQNKNKPFVSDANAKFENITHYFENLDEIDNYTVHPPENTSYQARLIKNRDTNFFDLFISIDTPYGGKKTHLCEGIAEIPPVVAVPTEENQSIIFDEQYNLEYQDKLDEIKAEARGIAEKEAARFIAADIENHKQKIHKGRKHELSEYQWDRSVIIHIDFTRPGARILAYKLYQDLFRSDKIIYWEFNKLNETQVECLLSPDTIWLISHKIIDFKTAKQLTAAGTKLIRHPYFLEFCKNSKNYLLMVGTLAHDQGQFLLFPPLINLLKQRKINIAEALMLPHYFRPLFITYEKLFLASNPLENTSINWWQLSRWRPIDCERAKNKNLAALVLSSKLSLYDIPRLSAIKFASITQGVSHQLFLRGIIDFTDFNRLSDDSVGYLESHPKIKTWLESQIIGINFICAKTPFVLHTRIFSRRLFSLMTGNPFIIGNLPDNLDSILTDLALAEKECHVTADVLYPVALYSCAKLLHKKLEYLIDKDSPYCGFYASFQEVLYEALKQDKCDWIYFFSITLKLLAQTQFHALQKDTFLIPHRHYKFGSNNFFARKSVLLPNQDELLAAKQFCLQIRLFSDDVSYLHKEIDNKQCSIRKLR